MNKERILELAEAIEYNSPEHEFNMESRQTCLIGWCALMQGLDPAHEDEAGTLGSRQTLMPWLGITDCERITMYLADGRRGDLSLHEITRAHAGRYLRKLAATGGHDWLTTENA